MTVPTKHPQLVIKIRTEIDQIRGYGGGDEKCVKTAEAEIVPIAISTTGVNSRTLKNEFKKLELQPILAELQKITNFSTYTVRKFEELSHHRIFMLGQLANCR